MAAELKIILLAYIVRISAKNRQEADELVFIEARDRLRLLPLLLVLNYRQHPDSQRRQSRLEKSGTLSPIHCGP